MAHSGMPKSDIVSKPISLRVLGVLFAKGAVANRAFWFAVRSGIPKSVIAPKYLTIIRREVSVLRRLFESEVY